MYKQARSGAIIVLVLACLLMGFSACPSDMCEAGLDVLNISLFL
jgi:hypothetical protein